jgi:biotin synthase
MKARLLTDVRRKTDAGKPLTPAEALAVLDCSPGDMPELFAASTAVRRRAFGDRLRHCSIVNAKGGACGEDCAFCAQSTAHEARAEIFPLRSEDAIASAGREAAALPIANFGVVTSGCALGDAGVERIAAVVRTQKLEGVSWCASLGCLTREQLGCLKEAGLVRFHHNIETAESFFPVICSTHTFGDRVRTIRAAKDAGLEVCAGGIFGMGETREQRVEFAFALAREGVDAIPLNFLIPIPGTRLAGREPLAPLEILTSIAMVRLTNPRAEVKVCAGRTHLRDLGAMIFHAGATGMMIGSLLTVAGRAVEEDLRMLADLGFPHAR